MTTTFGAFQADAIIHVHLCLQNPSNPRHVSLMSASETLATSILRSIHDVASPTVASSPPVWQASATMPPARSTSSSALVQIATIAASTVPTSLFSATGPVTVLVNTSTALAAAAAAASNIPSPSDDDTGECKLLGPFAVLVQGALGLLALSSLVYKRWRERPQRPVKIWAFDASKQVFGSALLHLANLFMSMFSAGEIHATIAKAAASTIGVVKSERYQPNPCSFYLLNLAIDTTIGIPILIVMLRLLTEGAKLTPLANPPESIISGNYGQPPRAAWWLKQSMIYFVGLLLMKACVFLVFELCPWIVVAGNWALRWTEGNAALQIAFVLLIFPLIMNALQYYIIDSFIKNNKPAAEDQQGHGEREEGEEDGLLPPGEAEHAEDVAEVDETSKPPQIGSMVADVDGTTAKELESTTNYGTDTPTGESSSSGSHVDDGNAVHRTT